MLSNAEIVHLTGFRHALHQQPELSGQEAATARAVAQFLAPTLPDRVVTGLGGHGVAVVYDSGRPGPTVMFRAELDALPIEETGAVPHRSRSLGKGHLCGHDGHMTILAGLGLVLGRQRPARGRVILMFQPAEEDGSGAARVLADPAFAPLCPDWVFALHNMPGLPLGHIAAAPGAMNCASMGLRIGLQGRTAHAAAPETGVSPAACVAELIAGLPDHAPGGAFGPKFRMATLCHLRIGAPAFGIAPGEAEVWLTLRTLTDAALEDLDCAIREWAGAVAARHDLTVSFAVEDHFHACTNDPEATMHLLRAAETLRMPLAEAELPMRASEDFGLFGHHAPAAMALIGSGIGVPALHNPDYDFPDALIVPGVQLLHRVKADLLCETPV